MNEQIRLYYYDASGQLVFVHFLEEFEDTKKNIFKLTDLYKISNFECGIDNESLYGSNQTVFEILS